MNYPKINLSESQKNEVNKFNTDGMKIVRRIESMPTFKRCGPFIH